MQMCIQHTEHKGKVLVEIPKQEKKNTVFKSIYCRYRNVIMHHKCLHSSDDLVWGHLAFTKPGHNC